MAKSEDNVLSTVAKKDLLNPKASKERCDLGDAWYELADKANGETRVGILRRALWWYQQGVDGLVGLAKAKVESRLISLIEVLETADNKEGTFTIWAVKPIARWRFLKDGRDSMGVMDGTLKAGATIVNGRLRIIKKGSYFEAGPSPVDIEEKTLEAWVYLSTLERPMNVMQIRDAKTGTWDGIVFAELQSKKCYPGSSFRHRSRNLDAEEEGAKPTEKVHVALVYAVDNSVSMYRNGKPYGASFSPQGDASNLQRYKKAVASIRLGHADPSGAIDIEEARLYNRALTAAEIADSFRLKAYRKN